MKVDFNKIALLLILGILGASTAKSYTLEINGIEFTVDDPQWYPFEVTMTNGIPKMQIPDTTTEKISYSFEGDGGRLGIAIDGRTELNFIKETVEVAIDPEVFDDAGILVEERNANGDLVPQNPLTGGEAGTPNVKAGVTPGFFVNLKNIMQLVRSTSYSIGFNLFQFPIIRSIPILNEMSAQVFTNYDQTVAPGSDVRLKIQGIRIKRPIAMEAYKNYLEMDAEQPVSQATWDAYHEMERNEGEISVENYIWKHRPLILQALKGLDIAIAVGQSVQKSQLLSGRTSTCPTIEEYMKIAGLVTPLAADSTMMAFMCKFSKETIRTALSQVATVPYIPGWQSSTPPPAVCPDGQVCISSEAASFIRNHMYGCSELRSVYRNTTERFPYLPVGASAEEIARLLGQSNIEGVLDFTVFAEAARMKQFPLLPAPQRGFFTDAENRCTGHAHAERMNTFQFISALTRPTSDSGTTRSLTQLAFEDAGMMKKRQVEEWLAGGANLTANFLNAVMNRYFTSSQEYGVTGKKMIQQEFSQQLYNSKTGIVPEQFTKKVTSNYRTFTEAVDWCVSHGMALMGEGDRGYLGIKRYSERLQASGSWEVRSHLDAYQRYKLSRYQQRPTCFDEVWVEYPHIDSERWRLPKLAFPRAPEYVANSLILRKDKVTTVGGEVIRTNTPTFRETSAVKEYDPYIGAFKQIDRKAGTVCVRGNKVKRYLSDTCPVNFSSDGYCCPYPYEGKCYEDYPTP